MPKIGYKNYASYSIQKMKIRGPLSLLPLTMAELSHSLLVPPTKMCKNCKFYIPGVEKCSKFGDPDFVNGDHNYKYASIVRENENYCGMSGKLFEKNNFKIVTVPYFYVTQNLQFVTAISLFGLYVTAVFATILR